VGFAGSFGSCRAIQGGFLLLAMLVSYLVNDTWSLPSLSRSTGYGLVVTYLKAKIRKFLRKSFFVSADFLNPPRGDWI